MRDKSKKRTGDSDLPHRRPLRTGVAFLILVALMGVRVLPLYPAMAQTTGLITPSQFAANPASLISNPAAIGQNAINLVQNGVSVQTVSSALTSLAGMDPASTSSLLSTLTGNTGVSTSIAGNIVNSVVSGSLTPNTALAVAASPSLGNVTQLTDLTALLSSPNIAQSLANLAAPQAAAAIESIVQGVASPEALQNMIAQGGVAALTNLVSQLSPQLASLLGGALSGAIGALLNGLGGSLSAAVTAALNGLVVTGPVNINDQSNCGKLCVQSGGCTACATEIPKHHIGIRTNIKTEFEKHEAWIISTFWTEHIAPALMLMAEQLSVIGMQQIQVVGALLDAKHQLETQRLFEQMQARAHKDYHPSEGMCTFGTNIRSLAASERRSDLAQVAFSQRMMQRQTLSGDGVTVEKQDSDSRSRLKQFIETYCDKADNGNGLENLCKKGSPEAARKNIDVDYTRNIESKLTLDIDFLADGKTKDEEDMFALATNLYSSNVVPQILPEMLGNGSDKIREDAAGRYLDLRSIFAKRSVAQNSFAALTSMRASGSPDVAPFMKRVIADLGVPDAEIDKFLGQNPSYFAQMEVLTKKIYQNPTFYTELYDKPANVERKGAALQAIGLMQDRDLYNSLLRSEAVLSVLLETMLIKEQAKIISARGTINPQGDR